MSFMQLLQVYLQDRWKDKQMDSAITSNLFFQGLCEITTHSALASSACEKKGSTFWVHCLSALNGSQCCRYLGISKIDVMIFSWLFYKCSMYAIAICLGVKALST